jgi:hypothetical protein
VLVNARVRGVRSVSYMATRVGAEVADAVNVECASAHVALT